MIVYKTDLLIDANNKSIVKKKLFQINSQELTKTRVCVKRKNVPEDTIAGPLVRILENPEDLVIHKRGEGEKPIFERDDIVVNIEDEERLVVPTSKLHMYLPSQILEGEQANRLQKDNISQPKDTIVGPLLRNLENPEYLVVHRVGEGEKPIFERDDIIVNIEDEERLVVPTNEVHMYLPSQIPEEESNCFEKSNITQPKDIIAGSLVRILENPEGLIVHRVGEGEKPIFERDDIVVNGDYSNRPSTSLTSENDCCNRENTRGQPINGSKFANKSVEERICYTLVKNSGKRRNSNIYEKIDESEKEIDKNKYGNRQRYTSRRTLSRDRRRLYSRDREHFRYHRSSQRRDYSRDRYEANKRYHHTSSPQRSNYRHYNQPPRKLSDSSKNYYDQYQDRRNGVRYREKFNNPREYRRDRSPYWPKKHRSYYWREYTSRSRSLPKYKHVKSREMRNCLSNQQLPHYNPYWNVFEPFPRYVPIIPEGYVAASSPRFSYGAEFYKELPVYNNRQQRA